MTTLPAANYMNDDARTQGEMKQAFEDQRQVIEDVLGVNSELPRINHNFLINPGFEVVQRSFRAGGVVTAPQLFTLTTTPPNDDNTVTLDRWVLLSDGDDIAEVDNAPFITDVPRSSQGFEHSPRVLWARNVTADTKFGFLQVLEYTDSAPLLGRQVSFSMSVCADGGIDQLRIAILTWNGGADAVARDCVETWPSAGSNPTFKAGWTLENTPAALALTASFQNFKIENITLSDEITDGATNVAIFFWTDDDDMTSGRDIYFAHPMLNLGTKAVPFTKGTFAEELAKCQRYCWGLNADDGDIAGQGFAVSTTRVQAAIHPPVTMRDVPTFTLVGAAGDFEVDDGVTATAVTAVALNAKSSRHVMVLDVDVASGLTQFRPYAFQDDGSSGENGDFFFDAEL